MDFKTYLKRLLTPTFTDAACAAYNMEYFLYEYAEHLNLDPHKAIQEGPEKDHVRVYEKAIEKYNGKAEKVSDIARWRLLYPNIQTILDTRQTIREKDQDGSFLNGWEQSGITLHEVDDSYFIPKKHGFRGLQLTFHVAVGKEPHIKQVKCELQFLHEHMQNTDRITHITYEEKRGLESKAKTKNRPLTAHEEAAINNYEKSIIALYEGDAENYELYKLERQKEEPHYAPAYLIDPA